MTAHGRPSPEIAIRTFRGDTDVPGMTRVAVAAALADGSSSIPTEGSVREDVLGFEAVDPERDVFLVELEGRVVATAWIRHALRDGEWRIDQTCYVDPSWRRRGIGSALFRAVAARGREIAAAKPGPTARRLCAYVEGDEAGLIPILEREGFSPFRHFALLARDLAIPGPDVPPVPGIDVRPVRHEERRAVFDAMAEAFQDHPGQRQWSESDFVRFFEGAGTDLTLWRVAWEGDEVAGFSANGYIEAETAALGIRQGWLDTIGVRRPWRGRGVAKLLIAVSVDEFRRRGFDRAVLGVDVNNPNGALPLYEGLGFVTIERTSQWTLPLPVPGE